MDEIAQYWLVLKRRWFPAALVFILTTAGAAAWTYKQTEIFQAKGQIILKKSNKTSALLSSAAAMAGGGGDLDGLAGSTPVNTQAEILKSITTIKGAINELKDGKYKNRREFKRLDKYSKKFELFMTQLKVSSVKGTDILEITFQDPSKELAKDVVDAIMAVYMRDDQNNQRREAKAAREYVGAELPRIESEVKSAENELRLFKEQYDIVDLPTESVKAVETITNLTCTAAVLSVVGMWNGPGPPTKRVSFLAGLILGCALLTKIQAILIPVPVVCWALWRWRQHAFLPLIIWGLTSLTFFYCLWPYLWSDPLGHSLEYLGRTTNRASIAVWYFGRKYVDKDVPWHYSFVLFGATVPLLLHGLGLLGLMGGPVRPPDSASPSAAAFRGRDLLLLSCLLFPLVVFALPGVAVYDGERLFLTSFPLWAIFIGRGWTVFWQKLLTWTHSISVTATIFVVLLTTLVWPLLAMSPCYLSYYNVLFLVPGVADRTKMEVDYWGEGITRGLLKQVVERVPAGATVAIAPVLHQFQVEEYFRQSSILRQHRVRIVAYESRLSPDYVLVFRRLADLPLELNPDSTEFEVHVSTERRGRQLAFLAQRRSPKSKPAVTATKLID